MLLVKNKGDGKAVLSTEKHKEFVMACEVYINDLIKTNNLKSAQPLIREGVIITGDANSLTETAFDGSKVVQVGYYYILANDLNEAVAIAKRNPEFLYVKDAQVEVRPIKTFEQSTQFNYPTSND